MKVTSVTERDDQIVVVTDSSVLPECVYKADRFKSLKHVEREIQKKIKEINRKTARKTEKVNKIKNDLLEKERELAENELTLAEKRKR